MICQYDINSAEELHCECLTSALKTIKSVVKKALACSSVLLKLRLTAAGRHVQLTENGRKANPELM